LRVVFAMVRKTAIRADSASVAASAKSSGDATSPGHHP
jgi:hypothetical protein